jgi:hypothetical protein
MAFLALDHERRADAGAEALRAPSFCRLARARTLRGSTMKPAQALALAALFAAGGCRGALGIGELDLPEDAIAEEGIDQAPETGGDEGGGPKGKAGGGGSGGGGRPGGGGSGAGAGEAKSCSASCAEGGGKKGLESYYGGAQNCACDPADPTSCSAVCGGDCDLKPDELASAPAACVACIAEKTRSPACQEALSDCDKECAAFRGCVEACPN